MKQIVILSGKGGTGKTTIAAAFAHLASQTHPDRAVLVDADVDASNLELVLAPQVREAHDFMGGQLAIIDQERCTRCGDCADICRFDAILSIDGVYSVDDIACEGCAACMTQCPSGAIHMEPQLAGRWFRSDSRYGPLFHAALYPGQENSGKLVTLIKQQSSQMATREDYELTLVDGPPGIGCPVIAAISGADMVVIVTEPTAAGIHDMKRTLQLAQHFGIAALVCINKADLYPTGAEAIRDHCQNQGLHLIGEFPFDQIVLEAMVQGQPITVYAPHAPASEAVREAWQHVLTCLSNPEIEPTR